MRKYLYAQMLLDVMTSMKRPLPQLKETARSWLTFGSGIPDIMDDAVSYHGMLTPYELQALHLQLVDKPVGKIRGKADEVLAWIAEEEEFEAWKDLPETEAEVDDDHI